jgi:hypothetical protein
MGRISEVCSLDGLTCHDVHIKFHIKCFMSSEVDKETHRPIDRMVISWAFFYWFLSNNKSGLNNLQCRGKILRLQVLTLDTASGTVFWNVSLCNAAKAHGCFEATFCLYFHIEEYTEKGRNRQRELFIFDVKDQNSVAWVRERTTPTEQQPLVGKISANFYG